MSKSSDGHLSFSNRWMGGNHHHQERGVIVASGNLVEDIIYFQSLTSHFRTGRTADELEQRSDYNSLSRSRTQFRRIFHANVQRHFNAQVSRFHTPIFITLTYAGEPPTEARARYDLKQMFRRMSRQYNFNPIYLAVPERGELTGRLHLHFAIFNLPFHMTFKKDLEKFWPHGYRYVGFRARKGRPRVTEPEACARYMVKYMQKDFKFRYVASRGLLRPVRLPDTERGYYAVSNELQKHQPEWSGDLRHGIKYKRYKVSGFDVGKVLAVDTAAGMI